MRLLQAIAAVVTLLLFLVRRRCYLTKKHQLLPECVDADDFTSCARGGRRPPCRKDPRINVDNEVIGERPLDYR